MKDIVTMDEIIEATECSYDDVTVNLQVLKLTEEIRYHVLEAVIPLELNSRVVHAIVGIQTEVGEYLDVWKKHWFYHKEMDHVNAAEELFDVLYYITILEAVSGERYYPIYQCISELCKLHNTDIDTIIEVGGKKLKARYPDGFTNAKALTRNLDVEHKILEDITSKE